MGSNKKHAKSENRFKQPVKLAIPCYFIIQGEEMRCPQFALYPVSRPVVCKSRISGELPERRSDMQISAERDVIPVLSYKRNCII